MMFKKEDKTEKPKKKNRNREYTVITYFFFFLFLALMSYFVYFQVCKSEEFINSPYNSLQDLYAKNVVRGEIKSSDGVVLAKTNVDKKGNESRVYPQGRKYAHVVGYAVKGKSGIENQENFSLLRSHQFVLEQIANDFKDKKDIGDNVITTLDNEIQELAYEGLGSYEGAVVVLEPSTGKILAMVSKPDFDPNAIVSNWESINAKGSTGLYNRVTQGQYTPGSTFKMLTALEYYRENPNKYKEYNFNCSNSFISDGYTIHCAKNEVHGNVNLTQSFAESCNTSFANIGLKINKSKLNKLCENMLFNSELPVAFDYKKSSFSLKKNDSDALTMQTCIGQGNTMVSPLHMAMIAGAVCNKGVLMSPYLVDRVEAYTGVSVAENKPKKYGSIMTKKESRFLQGLMEEVVNSGTGTSLKGQSYKSYGKTGTAEISDVNDTTNAWYVGYARKKGYKDIAVAVVVEKSGTGSRYAIPIAKKIFDRYFNR